MRADGELLVREERTKLTWEQTSVQPAGGMVPFQGKLAGCKVRYRGVRRSDGTISTEEVEFGPLPPEEAYRNPHGIRVARAKDAQTGIDILELREKDTLLGKLKLFPVKEVQEYVSQLGSKLSPGVEAAPLLRSLEFRFFVTEDAAISAMALPDGTILVTTGLLGALENEAQLAFVLGHEIAHVTQAHYWRHVHDTRAKGVGLIAGYLAAVAAAVVTRQGYIIALGQFLTILGMAAVINGYGRRPENQADRLALQGLIDHGYDPRQATGLFRIIIERYGNRTTSALWSSHDSSVLRGSFLTVQTQRRYPQADFSQETVDTEAFRAVRAAIGPVKVM